MLKKYTHLSKRIMNDGLMRDKIQEMYAMLVEGQDVFTLLPGVILPPHWEEAGTKQLPLGENLKHL